MKLNNNLVRSNEFDNTMNIVMEVHLSTITGRKDKIDKGINDCVICEYETIISSDGSEVEDDKSIEWIEYGYDNFVNEFCTEYPESYIYETGKTYYISFTNYSGKIDELFESIQYANQLAVEHEYTIIIKANITIAKSHIIKTSEYGYVAFLKIFGNEHITDKPLKFYLWKFPSNKIYQLETPEQQYVTNETVGIRPSNPIIAKANIATDEYFKLNLTQGWNLVSFPRYINSMSVNTFLYDENNPWIEGDEIKTVDNIVSAKYNGTEWVNNSGETSTMIINPLQSYLLYSKIGGIVYNNGHILPNTDIDRTINLKHGDNYIAYPFDYEMTVEDFLSNYTDVKIGDTLSCRLGFASYTENGWQGNLTTMTSGEGYILHREKSSRFEFRLPDAKYIV